jgi:ABC-2 type transport system permease protein
MKRIFAQAQKEIRQFWRDKLTVTLAIGLPTMTLLIFGYAIRLEEKNIPLAVQDFDNGQLSRELSDRLFATDQLDPVSYKGHDIVHSAVDSGIAQAAIIIPPEFSRKLKEGLSSPVEVLIDGTDVNNAHVIKNSIVGVIQHFNRNLRDIPPPRLIKASTRIWFNPGRRESLYVVPGTLGLIFWIYPSLLAAVALAREQEQGTILQAYASSITSRELLAGKALAYLIIGLVMSVLLISLSMVLFNLRFAGDPTPFIFGTIFFVLDSVLFGMMIGARTGTQSAAVQGVAFGGFTTALLLSGFLYPLRNIQYPLNYLSYIIPARYYMLLARDTFVRGSGWVSLGYLPLLLAGFALLYFAICNGRMKRMQITS